MATWSLGELSSWATRRTQRNDVGASDVSFLVNLGYHDYVRDVPELLPESNTWYSVVSETSLLNLPPDFMYPINMSWDTRHQQSAMTLRRIAPDFADAQGYFPLAQPRGYFIFGSQIQLWPSANSSEDTVGATSGRSYRLRYYALPEEMVSTTSVPSVATEHRIGILFKTEKYIHELVGNLEEAAEADLRYLNFVSTVKDSNTKRGGDIDRFAISLPDRARRRVGHFEDPHDRWLRT